MNFQIGDRVKVVQVLQHDSCFDIGVLIGQVGTVTEPLVDDVDDDGNPIARVAVTLDHKVDLGARPAHLACDFVFDPAELEAVQK